jgi:hypothetical protein
VYPATFKPSSGAFGFPSLRPTGQAAGGGRAVGPAGGVGSCVKPAPATQMSISSHFETMARRGKTMT